MFENPPSAKEAWDILADIFHDNKHTCSIALKAELRFLKLGDLTIDAYFRKIESIAMVLTSHQGRLLISDEVDPAPGNWNMDTAATSHLNDSVNNLSDIFNSCIYSSVAVGDGNSIPVTNSEFDPFVFSVKDFQTHRLLLRCDSTRPLYPIMKPSPIPQVYLTSQYTWHQHLGHPGSEVLQSVIMTIIQLSCNKEKSPMSFDMCPASLYTHCADFLLFRVETNCRTEHLNLHVSSISPLPKSYNVAFNDPNWQNTMSDEYNALLKNNTWTLVPLPTTANIVRCMWLFRHKFLADGTLSRYKARLVVNGSTQIEGIDVDETF
ncbi:ribonuclease H-like domain-containing protein [Tanacetum coccineum]